MDSAEAKLKELIGHTKTEISNKLANMRRVNAVELKPLYDDLKMLKNDMYADYLVLKSQAMIMYNNNEFYMQDIEKAVICVATCIKFVYFRLTRST